MTRTLTAPASHAYSRWWHGHWQRQPATPTVGGDTDTDSASQLRLESVVTRTLTAPASHAYSRWWHGHWQRQPATLTVGGDTDTDSASQLRLQSVVTRTLTAPASHGRLVLTAPASHAYSRWWHGHWQRQPATPTVGGDTDTDSASQPRSVGTDSASQPRLQSVVTRTLTAPASYAYSRWWHGHWQRQPATVGWYWQRQPATLTVGGDTDTDSASQLRLQSVVTRTLTAPASHGRLVLTAPASHAYSRWWHGHWQRQPATLTVGGDTDTDSASQPRSVGTDSASQPRSVGTDSASQPRLQSVVTRTLTAPASHGRLVLTAPASHGRLVLTAPASHGRLVLTAPASHGRLVLTATASHAYSRWWHGHWQRQPATVGWYWQRQPATVGWYWQRQPATVGWYWQRLHNKG